MVFPFCPVPSIPSKNVRSMPYASSTDVRCQGLVTQKKRNRRLRRLHRLGVHHASTVRHASLAASANEVQAPPQRARKEEDENDPHPSRDSGHGLAQMYTDWGRDVTQAASGHPPEQTGDHRESPLQRHVTPPQHHNRTSAAARMGDRFPSRRLGQAPIAQIGKGMLLRRKSQDDKRTTGTPD
jgi:hypothetical protein